MSNKHIALEKRLFQRLAKGAARIDSRREFLSGLGKAAFGALAAIAIGMPRKALAEDAACLQYSTGYSPTCAEVWGGAFNWCPSCDGSDQSEWCVRTDYSPQIRRCATNCNNTSGHYGYYLYAEAFYYEESFTCYCISYPPVMLGNTTCYSWASGAGGSGGGSGGSGG